MNIIPIVFAFDDKLILPACVCINSLLMNADKNTYYDIYILHSEKYSFIDTELVNFPHLYSNCNITFRTVYNEFVAAYEVRGITTTAYYRLLIPELIPEYDKILYSDVDVIFRSDMLKYYQVDLEDYYMAGVDCGIIMTPKGKKYIVNQLGIDPQFGYFYSGNLLINSALIRKDNLISVFKELSKESFQHQDMDIINIACNGKIKRLPLAFCLTNYINEAIVKKEDLMLEYYNKAELLYALNEGIVHFNGPKPWKQYCVHFDVWWEYYRKSPFFIESFYFDFFNQKQDEYDRLPFWKRVKILLRYFLFKK